MKRLYVFRYHESVGRERNPDITVIAENYGDAVTQMKEMGKMDRCGHCGSFDYYATGPDYTDGSPIVQEGYLYGIFRDGLLEQVLLHVEFIEADIDHPEGPQQIAVAVRLAALLRQYQADEAFLFATIRGELEVRKIVGLECAGYND